MPAPPHASPPRPRGVFPAALLLAAGLAALPACANDSYLAITLRSDGTSFAAITKIEVDVTAVAGQPMATRVFDVGGTAGVTIDATTSKSLSVSFTPDRSGMVTVTVSVFNATTCVGAGTVTATIAKGAVAQATVTLTMAGCSAAPDGGAPAAVTTFPGCDPTVAGSCPAPQTCYVDCNSEIGRCIPGGTKGPGETCAGNNDCAPGTQCFDFGCTTTTRACLKFCAGDSDCAALSTSAGGSTCRDPVLCPAMTTYKTCGLPCDPRGTAATGCPTGLSCFLFSDPAGGQDSPSCACPSATRVGTDGTACPNGSEDCAPGFLCDQMDGGQFCRRLCKMSSAGDCSGGQSCAALANNAVFGVCL